MKATHKTQKEDVLEYLQTHDSLSQMEAYRVFDAPITRLSAVIFDLRKEGNIIESVNCKGKNCYGKISYVKYSLTNE